MSTYGAAGGNYCGCAYSHVEHNSVSGTPFRLWLAKQLTKRTRWLVGVSEGVRNSLLNLGFAPEKCVLLIMVLMLMLSWLCRNFWSVKAVIMCTVCAPKDHATLIHAAALLKPRSYAGSGTLRRRQGVGKNAYKLWPHNWVWINRIIHF